MIDTARLRAGPRLPMVRCPGQGSSQQNPDGQRTVSGIENSGSCYRARRATSGAVYVLRNRYIKLRLVPLRSTSGIAARAL